MCLTKKYKWPRITLRPKTVYKVLEKSNKKLTTPFMSYTVELGKEYKGEYAGKDTLLDTILDEYVSSGFIHSYRDKETAIDYLVYGNVVVKCIIPRFTLYFVGHNDIASRKIYYDSIVIDKIVVNSPHFMY